MIPYDFYRKLCTIYKIDEISEVLEKELMEHLYDDEIISIKIEYIKYAMDRVFELGIKAGKKLKVERITQLLEQC